MQNNTVPEGYMTDSQGRLVLKEHVKIEDIIEDELVISLVGAAKIQHDSIRVFKHHAFNETKSFLDLLAEKYQISRGGRKGGVTLTSYDGLQKIVIAVQDFITFGAQLQIAKDLIDGCIKEWGEENANKNIQALVEHAFRVDKNNRINVQNIMGLKRINITDEKWKRAMQAIDDSVRVESSKEYIRFYKRPSPEGEWQAITLDIAKA